MKIKLDGKDYEIDIQRAKTLGLCRELKPIPPPISSFKIGDVFKTKTSMPMLIFQFIWNGNGGDPLYNIAGLDGLEPFSNFGEGKTKEQMLSYLNNTKAEYQGNINSEIGDLLRKFCELED